MSIREKRLLITAACIFSVSFLLFGLQFLMANNFFRPERSDLLSEEKKVEILARTRELRALLEPWAKKHQELLREMLRADEGNTKYLNQVWAMSPIVLLPADKSDPSRKIYIQDLMMRPVKFDMICGQESLQRLMKWDRPRTAIERQSKIEGDRILSDRKNFYWKKFRDAALVSSVNPGEENYMLWVSGRITRSILPDNLNALMRKKRRLNLAVTSDYHEVEPPFSFLK